MLPDHNCLYVWQCFLQMQTFGSLLQDGVEAAQRCQLQGEAERVDADAHQSHDTRVLQRVEHAGLLTKLGEAAGRVHRLQVLHHGVCEETNSTRCYWAAGLKRAPQTLTSGHGIIIHNECKHNHIYMLTSACESTTTSGWKIHHIIYFSGDRIGC